MARARVRLTLPPACAKPGLHRFDVSARVDLGLVPSRSARVEVVAARFAFGL